MDVGSAKARWERALAFCIDCLDNVIQRFFSNFESVSVACSLAPWGYPAVNHWKQILIALRNSAKGLLRLVTVKHTLNIVELFTFPLFL